MGQCGNRLYYPTDVCVLYESFHNFSTPRRDFCNPQSNRSRAHSIRYYVICVLRSVLYFALTNARRRCCYLRDIDMHLDIACDITFRAVTFIARSYREKHVVICRTLSFANATTRAIERAQGRVSVLAFVRVRTNMDGNSFHNFCTSRR